MSISVDRKIYSDIIKNKGAIFSEFPLGIKPLARNFPQRNRIIVGMAKGTFVAEAQMKSGAMISANLALDYNRELMCMPGGLLNPNTSGIYHLIKGSSSLIVNTQDILDNMNWEIKLPPRVFVVSEVENVVLKILSNGAKTFDEIMNCTKFEVSELMVILVELEMKELVKQVNSLYYLQQTLDDGSCEIKVV